MTRASEVELRLELLEVVHRLTRAEAQLIDRDLDAAVESIATARKAAQRLADVVLEGGKAAPRPQITPEQVPTRPPTDHPAVGVVSEVQEHFFRTHEARHDLLDERYVWDMSHVGGWPERVVYEGAEGFAEMLREWGSVWDEPEFAFEERFMGADGRVVTFLRHSGRPRGSAGSRVEMTYAVVSTVGGGKVLRDEVYDSWRGGLAAVGGPRR